MIDVVSRQIPFVFLRAERLKGNYTIFKGTYIISCNLDLSRDEPFDSCSTIKDHISTIGLVAHSVYLHHSYLTVASLADLSVFVYLFAQG